MAVAKGAQGEGCGEYWAPGNWPEVFGCCWAKCCGLNDWRSWSNDGATTDGVEASEAAQGGNADWKGNGRVEEAFGQDFNRKTENFGFGQP